MGPTIDIISSEALKAITQLVRDLTELRLRNSPNLCIENFAPEIFARLLLVYQEPERFHMDAEWFQMVTGEKPNVSDNN